MPRRRGGKPLKSIVEDVSGILKLEVGVRSPMGRPLSRGEEVPAFDADCSDGSKVGRESLRGTAYVLYFYPKDETPGCVTQACSFRDTHHEFAALGVPVYGVSRDSIRSHEAFAENHRLPFTLLADRDGSMHEAFGATMLGGLPRRVSYLVDGSARVAAVFDSHLRPAAHARRMADAAASLAQKK